MTQPGCEIREHPIKRRAQASSLLQVFTINTNIDNRGIKLKRVHDAPTPGDGYRILVDCLWPRGVSKQDASVSLWLRTIAPSTELRK